MTTITLPPDPDHSRPFYFVTQRETGAWGHSRFRWLAWWRMRRHWRYERDWRWARVWAWVVVGVVGMVIGGIG